MKRAFRNACFSKYASPIVNPCVMRSIVLRRSTIVLLIVALAGCATPVRPPDLAPPVQVSESTWRQIDHDIVAESHAAADAAEDFARRQMEEWKERAVQRAEADFIPWFSSYWTQQWLTAKVAWYNLSSEDTTDPPVIRLAAYLQEQYHDRVLAPVAAKVDPETVRVQATKRYIQRLGEQLQSIPQRYGVPVDQFERRIQDIPAIALAPPPAHNASLYQVVHAEQIDRLPAYATLLRQGREAQANAGAGLSKKRISPVARQVSEKMLDQLAISGGTSAASALVGGVAGAVISLGAAGFGVFLHEAGREAIETQLRETLNASMDDMWQILVEDPNTGVMAGIYYLSEQIEISAAPNSTQAVESEALQQEFPPIEPEVEILPTNH